MSAGGEKHAAGAFLFQRSAIFKIKDRFAVVEGAVKVNGKNRGSLGVRFQSIVDDNTSLEGPGLLGGHGSYRHVSKSAEGSDRQDKQHQCSFPSGQEQAAQNSEQNKANRLRQDPDVAGQILRPFGSHDRFLQLVNIARGKIRIFRIFIIPGGCSLHRSSGIVIKQLRHLCRIRSISRSKF